MSLVRGKRPHCQRESESRAEEEGRQNVFGLNTSPSTSDGINNHQLRDEGHNHWYCPIDVGSVDGFWQDESHAHLPSNQPGESAKLVDISVKPSNKEHSKK